MSLPAMSLRNRFCVSGNSGTRGSGWEHLQGANSMADSGLASGTPQLALGEPVPSSFA